MNGKEEFKLINIKDINRNDYFILKTHKSKLLLRLRWFMPSKKAALYLPYNIATICSQI